MKSESSFLENEKKFFDEIVKILDVYRCDVINNIIDGKQIPETTTEKTSEAANIEKSETAKTTKLVRFLHSVPKFVGKELEEYGPYKEEDTAKEIEKSHKDRIANHGFHCVVSIETGVRRRLAKRIAGLSTPVDGEESTLRQYNSSTLCR